ncbi:MAG TPA: STAS domain-containing protein [Anaerolineales bacterium]|nr:STAS domain-containing protein [Anaerolineales bacterium]
MSELNITSSQIHGEVPVTILHLSGHLHGNTEHQLLDRARQAYEDGSKYLLLDLSDLEILTSAGLRAIHKIFNLFTPQSDVEIIRKHGEEPYKSPYLKLVCPNPEIYYVLNIAGFLQNILIYNNMEDAVNSFSNGQT